VNKPFHILIAGAGIGGLCAALCAVRAGHRVSVFEAAEALEDVGAGIQLSPNAMRVMEALGLGKALADVGVAPDALTARMGKSGLSIFRVPLTQATLGKWGAPYFHIHRADLITCLATALEQRAPESLCLGRGIESFTQDAERVRVRLATGEIIAGNVLVGADGIHSSVRAQMLGADAPRFTGNVAWRAVVPVDRLGEHVPAQDATVWMGEGRHAVTYRLRGGTLVNVVGVVERADWQSESWSEEGAREEALSDFAGWHPSITTCLENAGTLYKWALYDRDPLPRWTEGRVALLGDAAHPMLPFMAQGAAMAIEDGWVIIDALMRDDPAAGLKRYEARRHRRASRVQAMSRANMKTFHKRGRVAQLLTYGPMALAGLIWPGLIRRRLNGVYGYDVTAKSGE